MPDQIRSGQVRKCQVKMDLTSGQIRSNRIMQLQVAVAPKLLSALIARNVEIPVLVLFVLPAGRVVCKCFPALRADVGACTCVDIHVQLHSLLALENLIT